MTRQMHVSLFFLLLLFLFVQLCSTSGILAEEQSTEVVQEVPKEGQGASWGYTIVTTNRTFIRINTSTEDLTEDKYCTAVGEVIKDFKEEDAQCQGHFVLSEKMKKTFLDTILPAAIKLHADRLLVDPVEGPLKVPEFEEGSVCKNFTVPPKHRKEGVENADMVLYVAARPENAFGVPCAYDDKSGRPVAGAINVQIYPLKIQRYNVRRVAHEIAHALGFDYKVFEKNNMVAKIESNDRKGRVVVNSNQTKKMTQKYYNCNELEGLELGYVDKVHTPAWSHLAWRNTNDDLMSFMYLFGAMHYSALTMSVFDDLPFYTVNWGMEESMSWGNQSGCELFKSECKAEDATKYPGRFCDINKDKNVFSCTSDRLGFGTCKQHGDDRHPENKQKCFVSESVIHPYYEKGKDHMFLLCSEIPLFNFPGSIFGNNDSLCLDTEEYSAEVSENGEMGLTGICARVSCDEGKVRVMYDGISGWQDCSENTSIEVNHPDSSNIIKIKCPKYSEVCTIFSDGSSLLPQIEPKRPPAPATTTTTTTTENNESHQEQGETHHTESGHTNNNSSSVPSQSAERTQDTTGVNVSTNENVTVPRTTEGNINKDNLTSPRVKEELKIRMG
ncbi:surface protease GP63, partial [Trypanosoma theileri]